MEGVLTIEEIRERFPSEWVLIGDLQSSERRMVEAGTVLYHSKDREEVDRKVLELRPKRCAIFYMGEPPEDMRYLL